jgi:hypothetical protein
MPIPPRSDSHEKAHLPTSADAVAETPAGKAAADAAGAEGKSRRALAGLMEDISRCRAEMARREQAANELRRRLMEELHPLEEKIRDVRLETFRILGRHLQSGFLNRRGQKDVLLALCDLADELESIYGFDLGEDRKRFLDADQPAKGSFFGNNRDVRYASNDPDGEAADEADASRHADGGAGEGDYDWEGLYRPRPGAKRPRDWDAGNEGARPEAGDRAEGRKASAGPGGSGGGKAGPRSGQSKARERRERNEEILAGDIRALYLMLARALHPDKESDPARREEKTAWMQKVTTAYAARDLSRLLDILAANPLDAVGPYLSQAPRKTVDGFAKRLRRELETLRASLSGLDAEADPFEAAFLKDGKVNEPAYNAHLAATRKELQARKRLRETYRTSDGARSLADALRTQPWRELM